MANVRDMMVRPLQRIFDATLHHGNGGGSGKASGSLSSRQQQQQQQQRAALSAETFLDGSWGGGSSHMSTTDARAASNVHLYALVVLRDELEGKGFRCHGSGVDGDDQHKAAHSVGHVRAMLEQLGAPLYGFALDDIAARAATAGGCRAWPGYVQADQMAQCWAQVTGVEEKKGWRYDYALRVRPDVAYKRSFRIGQWPLFAVELRRAMDIAAGVTQPSGAPRLIAGKVVVTSTARGDRNDGAEGQSQLEAVAAADSERGLDPVEDAMNDIMAGEANGAGKGSSSSSSSSPSSSYSSKVFLHNQRSIVAWAPCKCMTHAGGGAVERRLKRAQDVVWAVPRAGADALFGTRQEYQDRGCHREPWRETPL